MFYSKQIKSSQVNTISKVYIVCVSRLSVVCFQLLSVFFKEDSRETPSRAKFKFKFKFKFNGDVVAAPGRRCRREISGGRISTQLAGAESPKSEHYPHLLLSDRRALPPC